MARQDHYAILLAINHYPGIRDLGGPERDIDEFKNWLLSPAGGDVDPANIKTITSTAYAKVQNPDEANPTEHVLVTCLNQLLRDAQTGWKDRVGERLYLYMAGHGFTAGSSISDPALFSAIAQVGDTAHIAGYRYASKIANAKFFDEIVLVMDCCQDVLRASQVLEPTWSPPDRGGAAHVKFMQAYGAPRGQAAFEKEEPPGTGLRGNFSKVLLEALATASPDAAGFVTGQTLKNQLLQIWGDRYRAETGYDPPIRPPDGQDIRLFRRDNVTAAAGLGAVVFRLAPPVPANATLDITRGSMRELVVSMPAAAPTPQGLLPGLYKAVLTTTNRTCLFEVTGTAQQVVEL